MINIVIGIVAGFGPILYDLWSISHGAAQMLVIVPCRASQKGEHTHVFFCCFCSSFSAPVRLVFLVVYHWIGVRNQSFPEDRLTARGGFLVVVGGRHGTLGIHTGGMRADILCNPPGVAPPPPGAEPGGGSPGSGWTGVGFVPLVLSRLD